MSYCRWSSDNYQCDLYMYEDCSGGWTLHMAGRRFVDPVPPVPNFGSVPDAEWLAAHRVQSQFIADAAIGLINLPHAGETLSCSSLGEVRDTLIMLRELGYCFPDYVLESIENEIIEDEPHE